MAKKYPTKTDKDGNKMYLNDNGHGGHYWRYSSKDDRNYVHRSKAGLPNHHGKDRASSGKTVDHVDKNHSNNSKSNLKVVTNKKNVQLEHKRNKR